VRESHWRLTDFLPGIYRRSEVLKEFLWAFESTTEDVPGSEETGGEAGVTFGSLEENIDRIASFFDPHEAPGAFLPWLAQWVALTALVGPEDRQRRLIAEIVPLYRKRGTRTYVEELLRLYTGAAASVEEDVLPGMEVGVRSAVGQETRLGEDPFRFTVRMRVRPVPASMEERAELTALAHMVVRLAKPAHTHYELSHNMTVEVRTIVLAVHSTVGVDTLLWDKASTSGGIDSQEF
jgi:phage tail-like protein